MILADKLEQFYAENGLPEGGGATKKTFDFKVFGINLRIPNPEFRQRVVHIHDIQHVLFNQNTSWKGEAYIAGWELASGMWRHLPVGFFSLWAFGYSFWLYPKHVFKGFQKGAAQKGVIDLKISEANLLRMDERELLDLMEAGKSAPSPTLLRGQFLLWLLLSQAFFLGPAIATLLLLGFLFL